MNVVAATKRYVSDDRYKVRLFEVVGEEVRRVSELLRDDRFSVTAGWSEDELRRRIPAFDEIVTDLCRVESLICRWGSDAAFDTLTLPVKRLGDQVATGSGNTGWLGVQWYPVLRLFYAGGIAAVAAGGYDALRVLMHAAVGGSQDDGPLVTAVTDGLGDKASAFKLLPGLERHYVPCSEHLHDTLKPLLDELLFLGSDYERAFDRFEVLYALEYAHLEYRGWAPVGRFGWKIRGGSSPLAQILKEAETAGAAWPPLTAGLCGGSVDRLNTVAKALTEQLARNPRW